MIIILEGPDGAGKSTLAKALYNVLSLEDDTTIVHHGPYRGVEGDELAKMYFGSMLPAISYNKHVILDRSWYSEPIYADVYRKTESRISVAARRMLERCALSKGAVVIYCRPPSEKCHEAFGQRDEYLDSNAQLKEVIDKYEQWTTEFDAIPCIEYDYTIDSLDEICDAIWTTSNHENPYQGGGNFEKGNVLMLCSRWRVQNVKRNAVVVPYINFNEKQNSTPSASTVIANELERLGVSEVDLFWCNVESPDGQVLSTKIIDDMQPSKVIAIGMQPLLWAKSHGIDAIGVPQPNRSSSQFNLECLVC